MATIAAIKAKEGGTYIITAAFTDENSNPLTPQTITWTLTDVLGNVVNSREDVAVSPAASVNIVLSGADLYVSTHGIERTFTLEGTFNSITYGNNLPYKDVLKFEIEDLIAVSS